MEVVEKNELINVLAPTNAEIDCGRSGWGSALRCQRSWRAGGEDIRWSCSGSDMPPALA